MRHLAAFALLLAAAAAPAVADEGEEPAPPKPAEGGMFRPDELLRDLGKPIPSL